jgi:hypothetical protein
LTAEVDTVDWINPAAPPFPTTPGPAKSSRAPRGSQVKAGDVALNLSERGLSNRRKNVI